VNYSKFSSSSWFFPIKIFHVKICLSFCVVYYLISYTYTPLPNLAYGEAVWLLMAKNLYINWCFHWDLSPYTQIFSLPNSSSKLFQKLWPRKSNRPLAMGPPLRENPLPPWGASFPQATLTSAPLWKSLSLHHHRGSQRYPPSIDVRKPAPPNVRCHEWGDGESVGFIRPWTSASGT